MYKDRLKQLKPDREIHFHHTRLNEKLLARIPTLQESKGTYECVLTFQKDTGDALLQLSKGVRNDNDAVVLMRAANIVRTEIFRKKYDFNGDSQYDKVPHTLSALINMILGGPSIENQTENFATMSNASKSLTDLLVFNTTK